MSSYPRRSARLSPRQNQEQIAARSLPAHSVPTFSPYSHPSTTNSSAFPSPTNDSTNPPPPPPTPMQPQLRLPPHLAMAQQTSSQAPLPSPSAGDMDPFFGRQHSQPNSYSSQPTSGFMQHESQQQNFQQNVQEQHPRNNSSSNSMPMYSSNMQVMPGSQLPPDFLAEAAKRAQIACLMRDMGDISL